MGCAVEITDTGVEVEVHTFDDQTMATQYVTLARGYALTLSLGGTDPRSAIAIYTGAVEGECASIRRTPRGESWRACFWIEGDVRVVSAPVFESKPTWHGEFRLGGQWHPVTNSNGQNIAYASTGAALAGARFSLDEVRRNTVRSA